MFRDRETANKKIFIGSDFDAIKENWHNLTDKQLEKLAVSTAKLASWVEEKVKENKEK